MGAHRVGPCMADALCPEVVQRLRLGGEDADQQIVRQVCPAAVGLCSGMNGIRKGAGARWRHNGTPSGHHIRVCAIVRRR